MRKTAVLLGCLPNRFLGCKLIHLQIQRELLGKQLLQNRGDARMSQQRVRSQEHDRIGQQAQRPRQPQTVQEHLAEAQLIFSND